MTASPQRLHHEPEENDRLRVAMLVGLLDTIEEGVVEAINEGLADQLRERLAKHLPTTQPTPGIGGNLKGLTADQVNTLLGFHNCVQALDDHVRRVSAKSVTAKRDAACRDFIRDYIEKLKGSVRT